MGKPSSKTTPKTTNSKFWKFCNLADSQKAELFLYGDISETSWWGDEVTPKQFADDLAALGDVTEITVYINSGGGDVFAAQAIGNQLARNAATVTAHIDGLCARAATIVAPHHQLHPLPPHRPLPPRQVGGSSGQHLHGPPGQHGAVRVSDGGRDAELPESSGCYQGEHCISVCQKDRP